MINELLYCRGGKSADRTIEQLKTMIRRYYMSYWNNSRICSAYGGIPPAGFLFSNRFEVPLCRFCHE